MGSVNLVLEIPTTNKTIVGKFEINYGEDTIILGHPYLGSVGSTIDCKMNTWNIQVGKQKHVINQFVPVTRVSTINELYNEFTQEGTKKEIHQWIDSFKAIARSFYLKENYKEVFDSLDRIPPTRKGFDFEIKLKEGVTIQKSKCYPVPLSMEQELKYQLTLRLKKLWIERTKSEFSAPVLFAKKNNGKWRISRRVKSIMDWPVPTDKTAVLSFLGTVNYCKDFIKDLATIADPLYRITKKSTPFIWDNEMQTSFQNVKTAVSKAVALNLPDTNYPFHLECDASNIGIGSVLYQIIDIQKKVLAFMSRKLTGSQLNWSVLEKEAYVIVKSDHQVFQIQLRYRSKLEFSQIKEDLNKSFYGYDQYNTGVVLSEMKLVKEIVKGCKVESELINNKEIKDQYDDLVVIYQNGLEWTRKENQLKIIAPQVDKVTQVVIETYHDSALAGHWSVIKTSELIKRNFYWDGMTSDITQYLVDRLSKFVVLIPISSRTTSTQIITILQDQEFFTFGTPSVIISDNDPLFTCKVWDKWIGDNNIRNRVDSRSPNVLVECDTVYFQELNNGNHMLRKLDVRRTGPFIVCKLLKKGNVVIPSFKGDEIMDEQVVHCSRLTLVPINYENNNKYEYKPNNDSNKLVSELMISPIPSNTFSIVKRRSYTIINKNKTFIEYQPVKNHVHVKNPDPDIVYPNCNLDTQLSIVDNAHTPHDVSSPQSDLSSYNSDVEKEGRFLNNNNNKNNLDQLHHYH
ncbi:hypothetical protein ACTFIZ_012334 [Dictyostelium cf. discoideum]